MNDVTKLDLAILVLASEKHHKGARRVPLDKIMDLPQVEKDSRGIPSLELWRAFEELQEDGLLQLHDLKVIRGSHGTYRYTRESQNPGISITPTGIQWVARRTATEDSPNEMPNLSGDLNEAIMGLVYREYHARRPVTTMEAVMNLNLAKDACKDVVYSHIADLGRTGLLNLHGMSVIAGKAVVMEFLSTFPTRRDWKACSPSSTKSYGSIRRLLAEPTGTRTRAREYRSSLMPGVPGCAEN